MSRMIRNLGRAVAAMVVTLAVVALCAGCHGRSEPDASSPAAAGGSTPAQASPQGASVLVAGEQLSCELGETVRCWGGNPFLVADSSSAPDGALELGAGAISMAIGRHHACLLEKGGGVACWGSNLARQLGVAAVSETCIDRPCSRTPVSVPALPAAQAVVAGAFHTCALASDGTVWCWGANDRGQLGRTPSTGPGAPAPVVGITAARAIAAGFLHTCAVLADGTVWCWGDGADGRLGADLDATIQAQPVQVAKLAGPARAVTAGVTHTCALLADGSVACWGGNRFGELGDGTTTARPEPAPVVGLTEPVAEVVAGDHFTCARLERGTVACWGWNDSGQLGQGSFDGPAEPGGFSAGLTALPVGGLPGPARSLAAGAGHACVLVGNAAWCWGRNEVGQLGDPTRLDRFTPVAAGGAGEPPAPRTPAVAEGEVRGLDVSYHSGRIDWSQLVEQGHGFAFTLSTAGVDAHDPMFYSHWVRMDGLYRGAYHFFVAHDDPAAQARWFIANTPLGPGDLAPVVDIETMGSDPPPDLARRLRLFVAELERHYRVKPIIYTGPVFWDQHLGPGYGDHALWIAEYGVDQPRVPTGWSGWTLWQDSGDATTSGVERVADLDRISDHATLQSLLIPER